ncbi:hypothetical protein A3C32_01595 [Candidatus Daviesbacteria bacterium RIFCSPHIGHO2_02_FULL_41_14]|nr:MAG: hypothetical protein A2780_00850 [Candidatus Daviesbacteria bacterium RIFCSPHIGHO2_01_FULL_41_45]OGE34849.1 MAG: hypothetical protein A3C32_01595 [Candidatus Daviesbacteria bacterium RIFCSPHIGHO2_02_FULL_41_14]
MEKEPTKRELREARRIAQQEKIQKQFTQRRLKRKLLLGITAVSIIGSATTIAMKLSGLSAVNSDTRPQTAPILASKENIEVINQEINRLRIAPDPAERAWWVANSFPKLNKPLSLNNETKNMAGKRVVDMVSALVLSKNPKFTEAGRIFNYARDTDRLAIRVYDSIDDNPDDSLESVLSMGFEIAPDNKLRFILAIEPISLLTVGQDLDVAVILTHEATHLKRMLEIDDSNILLPAQQKYQLQVDRLNSEGITDEETEAYSVEAQSRIIEMALLDKRATGKGIDDRVIKFIQTGSNSKSPLWRKYIQENWIPDQMDAINRK